MASSILGDPVPYRRWRIGFKNNILWSRLVLKGYPELPTSTWSMLKRKVMAGYVNDSSFDLEIKMSVSEISHLKF